MQSERDIKIEEVFGREFLLLSEKRKQYYIEKAVEYWRTIGFPYSRLSNADMLKDYYRIERTQSETILCDTKILSSTVGLSLANSFHPQMWHITSQHHAESPIDHFHNDDTLRKLLRRAPQFWPNRRCWQASNIRNIFGIYSGGRVANFRPLASKAIIEKFSNENAEVLDFCSGFGGRSLGSLSLKRHYVGIDASKKQIVGVKKMYNAIKNCTKGTAEFHHGCAEEIMPMMKPKSFDLIFTSPPYFNLEKYCVKKEQSYLKYNSYEEWKSGFLKIVIKHSYRLLKPNGYFIINIADSNKYSIAKDFEKIAGTFFDLHAKYSLDLNARPMQRKNGNSYKSEPVYIFKKK